MKVKVDQD